MLVRFENIQWDTDGSKTRLADSFTFHVSEDFDVEADGADFLADKLGFLVTGFNFTIKKQGE